MIACKIERGEGGDRDGERVQERGRARKKVREQRVREGHRESRSSLIPIRFHMNNITINEEKFKINRKLMGFYAVHNKLYQIDNEII